MPRGDHSHDERAYALPQIVEDEIGRRGGADPMMRRRIDSDGLARRQDVAIAKRHTHRDDKQQNFVIRKSEEQKTDREKGDGREHDDVISFSVEEFAAKGPDDEDHDGVDDEESRSEIRQIHLDGIGVDEGRDAGVANAHDEDDDGDGQRLFLEKICDRAFGF